MNTLVTSACLLFLLLGATGPARAADGSTDAPRMDDFTLIEESRPYESSARAAPSQLRRVYRLGTGETIELVHTEQADGLLELDATQQSPSTLDALDRYCARIGGTVSRDGVSVFSPQTQTLLSCVGTAPRPGKPDQTKAETIAPSAKRNSCGATSSIVMDGPGSVYRGDPGGYAVHADAEFETVSSQVVSWLASFIPGCNVGESVSVNKWLWVSRGVVCSTGGLSPGIHEGNATLSVCGHFDQSSIATEIWALHGR